MRGHAAEVTIGSGRVDPRAPQSDMNRIHDGSAELTFVDCPSVVVSAQRVLVTMTDEGDGALRISPGTTPNMTEIETALESGPFTLTAGGVMVSCKPRHWIIREVTDSVCEMVVLFEPQRRSGTCGSGPANPLVR